MKKKEKLKSENTNSILLKNLECQVSEITRAGSNPKIQGKKIESFRKENGVVVHWDWFETTYLKGQWGRETVDSQKDIIRDLWVIEPTEE